MLLSTLPSGWLAGSGAPQLPGAVGALCRAENKAEGNEGLVATVPIARSVAGAAESEETGPAEGGVWRSVSLLLAKGWWGRVPYGMGCVCL